MEEVDDEDDDDDEDDGESEEKAGEQNEGDADAAKAVPRPSKEERARARAAIRKNTRELAASRKRDNAAISSDVLFVELAFPPYLPTVPEPPSRRKRLKVLYNEVPGTGSAGTDKK